MILNSQCNPISYSTYIYFVLSFLNLLYNDLPLVFFMLYNFVNATCYLSSFSFRSSQINSNLFARFHPMLISIQKHTKVPRFHTIFFFLVLSHWIPIGSGCACICAIYTSVIRETHSHTHTHKSPFFIILFEYCEAAKKQQQKHVSVNINKTNGTTTEQPRGKKNNPNNPLKIDKMSLQMVWRQNISIFRNKKVYFIWFIDVLDLRKSKFLSIFFRVFLLFFSLHLRCTFFLSPKSTNWSPIISKKNSQVIEKHSKTTPITEYIYTKIGYVKKYCCLCRIFLCFMMIIFVCFCAFRWCVLVSHPVYILTYQLTAKKKRKH